MIKEINKYTKPKIGFFPFFNSVRDTLHLLKVADYYKKLGGEIVFYRHGGIYEDFALYRGFKEIKVKP